jgi:hypothetical protein
VIQAAGLGLLIHPAGHALLFRALHRADSSGCHDRSAGRSPPLDDNVGRRRSGNLVPLPVSAHERLYSDRRKRDALP